MNYLPTFYSSLASILILISLGFLLGRAKILNDAASKVIANLLLMVAMPCALFAAFPTQFSQDSLELFLWAVGGGVLSLGAGIIVAKFLFRRRKIGPTYFQHQFAYIFNNASFLGYPLTVAVFGAEPGALIAYSGLMLVFNFSLFSYGVWLFQKRFSAKLLVQMIFNPNIIAVTLGLICFLVSYQPPSFITASVDALKNLTTPLSLLAIGFMLHLVTNWKVVLAKTQLWLTCSIQLLLMPAMTFAILYLIRAPRIIALIFTMIQALPTATSLGLFAEKYHGNKLEASQLVLISTLLSVITLPTVMTLILMIP